MKTLRMSLEEARQHERALGALVYTADGPVHAAVQRLRATLRGETGDWVDEEPPPAPGGSGEPPCDLDDERRVMVYMLRDLLLYFQEEPTAHQNLRWLERKIRSLAIEAGKPLP